MGPPHADFRQRNRAALAQGRRPDPADEWTAKEILAKKDGAHAERVKAAREGLHLLKAEAKRERKALESFIVPSIVKKG